MKTRIVFFLTVALTIVGCDRGSDVPAQTEAALELKENWETGKKATTSSGPKLKTDWNKKGAKPPQGAKPSSKTPASPKLKVDWNKKKSAGSSLPKKVNGFERLTGCQLVDHRNNDGDSFHIKQGGKTHELRLYYVDTAEKYYSDRYEDQRKRVREQGKDFGGLSVDQVIQLGNDGKKFSLDSLKGKTFTIYTKWEEVYDSGRYYAFVEVPGTKGKYLSELLVASGLVRIHTKGVSTPDGRDYRAYRNYLNQIERAAKKAGMGAWGM